MDTTESFGNWVRRRRKSLDMTQDDLARRVGCAKITLRKIEADDRRPSRLMAERLAQCLALNAEEKSLFLDVSAGNQPASRLVMPSEPLGRLSSSNLPIPMTSLIGRSKELEAITNCLRRKDVRLHTLTGPVGVGKTRLAIEAGLRLRQEFRDGVYLIGLETVQDVDRVPRVTASVLGVREARDRSILQSIIEYLAQKEILLIFDNFEHLQLAASYLSELLHCAPNLRLLVTSRVILHLYGEHEFRVSPMPLPVAGDLDAAESASVQLFFDRAQAVQADFNLTPDLLPVVAEICRRLDGLPLAIELAAARIKLFTPQELLQRLGHRLSLLVEGPMDLPPRAQVLEHAIAWSYGLLSSDERILFSRLAVFVGGFTLAAAEAIYQCPSTDQVQAPGGSAAPVQLDIASGLTRLIDQSLLQRQKVTCVAGQSRFLMLETIREYALQQLGASGELELLERLHDEYFSNWVEQAAIHLYGPDQADWLTQMELDIENLRAVLARSLEDGQIETAARTACALAVYWRRRGFYGEGRDWLELVLSHPLAGSLPDQLQARVFQAAGSLAYRQGDWSSSRQWLGKSMAFYQSFADKAGIARILYDLGWIAIEQGDWTEAARLNQESLALSRENHDCLGMYRALTNLGWTKLCTLEKDEAEILFREAHDQAQRMGHTKGIAVSLVNLAWIALYQDDLAQAEAQATQSLRLCHILGEREILAECLEVLATTAVWCNRYEYAAYLSGASEALWQALRVTRSPAQHSVATHQQAVSLVRQQIPKADMDAAWQRGRAASPDTIVLMTGENFAEINRQAPG